MTRRVFEFVSAILFLFGSSAWAQIYNTYGATPGVAIDGYDTVAYFTSKRAVRGSPDFSHDWGAARWYFSSAENKALFLAQPEKFAPQYGGYCALNVAFGRLSKKPVSTDFEVYQGKLYIFGTASGSMNPKQNWWQDPRKNVRDADKEWERLKKELTP